MRWFAHERKSNDLELLRPLGGADRYEPGLLQEGSKRRSGKSSLVCVEVSTGVFDLLAKAIEHIVHEDRPGLRNVERISDIEILFDTMPHDAAYIGDPDFREPIRLQDVAEALQYLATVMPEVVLEVVRTIYGIELPAIQFDESARVTDDIRVAPGIHVEQEMIPALVMAGNGNALAPSPDIEYSEAPVIGSGELRRRRRSFWEHPTGTRQAPKQATEGHEKSCDGTGLAIRLPGDSGIISYLVYSN